MTISFPCIIAPTAFHRLANSEHGELATVRAAVACSTIMCVSTMASIHMKQIAEEAKDRVGTFFKNFSEKLYISKAAEPSATAGLSGEQTEEQVTYFVNPYSETKELDMSAIDRIQEQIATMNGSLNEVEREF